MLENQGEVSNEAIQPIMPAGVGACSPEGQKIKAEHEAKKWWLWLWMVCH